ncbi:MAG: hypothetical protein JWO38_7379 [Gemmataceae bacterium]|nr:hypothetical protein [Gemmataceae bacterium]
MSEATETVSVPRGPAMDALNILRMVIGIPDAVDQIERQLDVGSGLVRDTIHHLEQPLAAREADR